MAAGRTSFSSPCDAIASSRCTRNDRRTGTCTAWCRCECSRVSFCSYDYWSSSRRSHIYMVFRRCECGNASAIHWANATLCRNDCTRISFQHFRALYRCGVAASPTWWDFCRNICICAWAFCHSRFLRVSSALVPIENSGLRNWGKYSKCKWNGKVGLRAGRITAFRADAFISPLVRVLHVNAKCMRTLEPFVAHGAFESIDMHGVLVAHSLVGRLEIPQTACTLVHSFPVRTCQMEFPTILFHFPHTKWLQFTLTVQCRMLDEIWPSLECLITVIALDLLGQNIFVAR